MSRNKKPRKAYRPRPVTCETLTLALHHAAKPSDEDLQDVLQPIAQCVKALREGVATESQWAIAAGAVQMAKAVERQGVVRGMVEHWANAERALQGIYRRAMTGDGWKPTALYYQELDALQEFLSLHTFQIRQLGRREFIHAIDGAERQVRKDGHVPTVARTATQLQLA